MPISDYLISLALALHPHGDAKLPLTLGADAVGQPDGAVLTRVLTENLKAKQQSTVTTTGGPQKCASGEHMIKFWRPAATGRVQAVKCEEIKHDAQVPKVAGEH